MVLALALAAAAAGCTDGGGTFDGSCARQRSRVTALDADNGSVQWSRSLPHPREDPPVADSQAVLLRGCGVVVLSTRDGRVLHRRASEQGLVGVAGTYLVTRDGDATVEASPAGADQGFGATSSPPYDLAAVAGDVLLLAVGTRLSAYDLGGTPSQLWSTELPTLGDATFHVAGRGIVVRASDGSVYRVDGATGHVAWRAVPGPPALGYGTVLAVGPTVGVVLADPADGPDRGRTVVGLDLASGAERWRARLGTEVTSRGAAAIANGVLVVPGTGQAGNPAGLLGIEATSGRVLWRHDGDAASLAGAGDVVVFGTPDAAVALDARSGRARWRFPTRHPPLLAAGPGSPQVLVLDSPTVAHGYDDCC
ncbi:MAG: outer membrane protein assembly factor BamB family protein [Actinomycetes bacterium]